MKKGSENVNKSTLCYLRVSTDKQKTDSQRRELEKYLREHGVKAEWFEDHATGRNQRRAAFQLLLGRVQGGWVDVVYCYDVTRVGRNLIENLNFAKSCLDRKTRLIGVKDNTDISTPDGRLKFNLLSAMAEYQREDIVERTKAGIAARKARGLPHGGTSKGWTARKIKKDLPKFWELVDLGFSNYHIRRVLGWNYRTCRKYREMRKATIRTRKELNTEVYGSSDAVI